MAQCIVCRGRGTITAGGGAAGSICGVAVAAGAGSAGSAGSSGAARSPVAVATSLAASARMYQKCLAAGGARVDLEGNVAGKVSNEHRSRAERLVARIEARQLAVS
jgi:ProQ/FINO family